MNQPFVFDETRSPHKWHTSVRIGFRFAFCYLVLFLFCNGNVSIFTPLDLIVWTKHSITTWLHTPFEPLTEWLGEKVFHLSGVAAKWHGTGSGDTAQDWILLGLFILISALATIVWSLLDRKREGYPVLYSWMRLIVRMVVGVTMFWYGFDKVFPIQMQWPTIGVLNEPFGQVSPMTLLWSMLGTVPGYQIICGCIEVISGLLLLVRKTALAGALLALFVMTNVLLYNLFFDVPVKLFAANVILCILFVILADVKSLFYFFILNRSAELTGGWVPPMSRPAFVKAMRIVEVSYLFLAIVLTGNSMFTRWNLVKAGQQPSPLLGAWVLTNDSPTWIKTPEGHPWKNIYFDNTYRAMVRDDTGQLWRYALRYDATKATVEMRGPIDFVVFSWISNGPNSLTLVATHKGTISVSENPVTAEGLKLPGEEPIDPSLSKTFRLDRQPTANSYVLYQRGFHFVNEWGYEH